MDSLFAKYLHERQGVEMIQGFGSFATYKINGPECFLTDIFVDSESREKGQGRWLVDQVRAIAVEAGCTCLTANVHLNSVGANTALRSAMAVGFNVIRATNDILLISMDIGDSNGKRS